MPETDEIVISEFVQEYLEPISSDSPTGVDASNEEEYFKLNMEIPKTSPDYKKCIEFAGIILKERSKDIKVATWLCFALFRTEKIKGLHDGLDIIYQLMNKFGSDLHPSNIQHRSKAIQFINTSRFYKLVEREKITAANATNILESEKIIAQIIEECKKLFPENLPVLKSINETLKAHGDTARKLTAPKKTEVKPPEPAKPVETASVVQPKATAEKSVEQVVSSQPSPTATKFTSEKDGISQLRKMLLFFFESEEDGIKKEKLPENHFLFGISRQLQWSKLIRPQETDKVTSIEAPNQIIQGKLKEWFAASNWDTLIPRIEINFLKGENVFRYWMDLQRYSVKALEQKGGNYVQAAEDIKFQLARLLNRIPDITQLSFKDKQTPFADPETVKWIDDEVLTAFSKGKSGESAILPPIMGEDYDPLNKEYEAAISELPEKMEENIASMQKAIDADNRRKGKFLRRLNLANYCIQAKQFYLAKVNLLELKELVEDYKLANWEPALCTAVWQSLYLTNKKILSDSADSETKSNIEKEQKELFSKIAKYDGILAIKLTQKNKK
jgi:type VI secretion system protein VasJ